MRSSILVLLCVALEASGTSSAIARIKVDQDLSSVTIVATASDEDEDTGDILCSDSQTVTDTPAGGNKTYSASASCSGGGTGSMFTGDFDGAFVVSGDVSAPSGIVDATLSADYLGGFRALDAKPTLDVSFHVAAFGSQGDTDLSVELLNETFSVLDSFHLTTLSFVEYDQVETLTGGPFAAGAVFYVRILADMNAYDGNFNGLDIDDFTYSATVGVHAVADVPVPRLVVVGPTPFRSSTTLAYTVDSPTHLRCDVVDTAGRLTRVLVDGDVAPGVYEVRWDGRSERGIAAPPGTYYIRGVGRGAVETAKIVLVR